MRHVCFLWSDSTLRGALLRLTSIFPITISYSYAGPPRTRAISHAATSFLEGIAGRQRAHVSADVSVHYIGQRRAYQAKTCSLSLSSLPHPLHPLRHCHSSCWLHPQLSWCFSKPPLHTHILPHATLPIRFNRVCARLRGPSAHVICHSNGLVCTAGKRRHLALVRIISNTVTLLYWWLFTSDLSAVS